MLQITLKLEETSRRCGDCQLCCKLVPVKDLGKPAGARCQHQRAGKGCLVHAQLGRVSPSCALWSCQWLNGGVSGISRPDRSHYVIDPLPDYVTISNDETGERTAVEVLQVWVDPDYPQAHRDPALRAYLERESLVALVRFSNRGGVVLFPPSQSADRRWHEEGGGQQVEGHTIDDVVRALGGAT